MMKFLLKNMVSIIKILYILVIFYLSPTNYNYWWNFGSIALIILFLKILAMLFIDKYYSINIYILKYINIKQGRIEGKVYIEFKINELNIMEQLKQLNEKDIIFFIQKEQLFKQFFYI